MILTVKPPLFLKGCVDLPSSKSYTIRAFIIAACGGTSTIINPSDCDDAKVAVRVTKQLGARIIRSKENIWKVRAFNKSAKPSVLNVKESGTVLRFILPLLALRGKRVKVTGEGTLRPRPNQFLTQTLRRMGVRIFGQGARECVPINIEGGRLRGGRIKIDGTLSSQFISSLLTVCPNLEENTRLIITGRRIDRKSVV